MFAGQILRRMGILLILFFSILGYTQTIFGDNFGIEISPPGIDLQIEPGSERTFDVLLGNPSDSNMAHLKVWISPVEQDVDGQYNLVPQSKWSAVPWLQLNTDTVSITPKSNELIYVKAKVPKGATGTRVAAIVYEFIPEKDSQQVDSIGGSVTFVHRFTTIVIITAVNRRNKTDATINSLSVLGSSDKRFSEYGQNTLAVVCNVTNQGDTAINGQGWLIIRSPDGRRIKEAPLGAGQGTILPGAAVDLVSIFPKGLIDGKYTVEVVVRYGVSRPLQAKVPFDVANNQTSSGKAEVTKAVRLTVNPTIQEVKLPAGAYRTFIMSLVNHEDYPLTVRVAIKNLNSTLDGTFLPAETTGGDWSATSWFSQIQDHFDMEPGEKKNYKFTISVPKDIKDGVHYAALVLEAEKASLVQSGTVTQITTPFVITVGKELNKKASITQIWLEQPNNPGPILIYGILRNDGNTHFNISGKVVLRRKAELQKMADGIEYLGEAKFEDFETITLGDAEGWVLPGVSVPISVSYDKQLSPGEYQAEILVDIGDKLPVKSTAGFKIIPNEQHANP